MGAWARSGLISYLDKQLTKLILLKATSHLTIFWIPVRAMRYDKRCHALERRATSADLSLVKATFHLTIFDIPMRPMREDQRHRRRFTR